MREAIDKKFVFIAVNHNGKKFTEEDGFVFLAKDNAVPDTLRYYRQRCEELGTEAAQLKGIDLLIERVDRFRAEHPDICKVADVTPREAEEILKDNEKGA